MSLLEEIRALYEGYDAEFYALEDQRRGTAGIFGLLGGPRDYPCHRRFSQELEGLLRQAPPEEASPILDYIYFAPQARPGRRDAVYWMLMAVHGLTRDLIPRLPPEDARRLLERYEAAYPRRDRLPVQKTIISALKNRAERG